MGELAEEQRQFEELPEWVPTYLAAWGSVRPDGKAMSVEWAAGLAGVTASAVRNLRARDRRFKTLEYVARHGGSAFMASYADAGIRGAAPAILSAFLGLVADGNAQAVLQGMKWLLGTSDSVDVHLKGVVATDDVSELSDVELDERIAELFAAIGEGEVVPGAEGEVVAAEQDGDQPLHPGGTEGRSGPPDEPGAGA